MRIISYHFLRIEVLCSVSELLYTGLVQCSFLDEPGQSTYNMSHVASVQALLGLTQTSTLILAAPLCGTSAFLRTVAASTLAI